MGSQTPCPERDPVGRLLYTRLHTSIVSEVVQFREDEEKLERLRRAGIRPNEFARDAFERAYSRLVAVEAMARMAAASARGDKTKPVKPARLARDARRDLGGRGR